MLLCNVFYILYVLFLWDSTLSSTKYGTNTCFVIKAKLFQIHNYPIMNVNYNIIIQISKLRYVFLNIFQDNYIEILHMYLHKHSIMYSQGLLTLNRKLSNVKRNFDFQKLIAIIAAFYPKTLANSDCHITYIYIHISGLMY